jgi:hypothetical protein
MGDKVEDTVDETVVDTVEETIEEVKDDVKLAAKKLTDSDTHLSSDEIKENKDNPDGGKDFIMNPDSFL